MAVLPVDDYKVVVGEGWGEGDEVVVAVEVWSEKVVDLIGEEVAVRFMPGYREPTAIVSI
ncbi:unnamed protein product [Prunus armeniaca]|uniref:Uncharacterized protein n=1 Tax=Prunus armeniaca TaxID=36596 RepID=A0A6J5VD43_PRUAR|nr:unnamed protein product [Prunus armeniaca]